MLRDYKFTIAAGESDTIDLDVNGFVVTDANLERFDIEINDDAPSSFERQFEFNAPKGERIKKLRIVNDNLVPLALTLKAWSGLFRDRRAIFNQVQGVNPRSLQEIADTAYVAIFRQTGGAAVKSLGILFNPASSGKVLAVKRVVAGSDTAGEVLIRGVTTTNAIPVTVPPQPKFLGGAAAKAVAYSGVEATGFGDDLSRALLGANKSEAFEYMDEPILVPEGRGVLVQTSVDNTLITGYFDYLEIDG